SAAPILSALVFPDVGNFRAGAPEPCRAPVGVPPAWLWGQASACQQAPADKKAPARGTACRRPGFPSLDTGPSVPVFDIAFVDAGAEAHVKFEEAGVQRRHAHVGGEVLPLRPG